MPRYRETDRRMRPAGTIRSTPRAAAPGRTGMVWRQIERYVLPKPGRHVPDGSNATQADVTIAVRACDA